MRYKVIRITQDSEYPRSPDTEQLLWAKELQEKFDLYHLTIDDINLIWSQYSEDFCAGWLYPDKESVEHAFGVELEEINDNSEES